MFSRNTGKLLKGPTMGTHTILVNFVNFVLTLELVWGLVGSCTLKMQERINIFLIINVWHVHFLDVTNNTSVSKGTGFVFAEGENFMVGVHALATFTNQIYQHISQFVIHIYIYVTNIFSIQLNGWCW